MLGEAAPRFAISRQLPRLRVDEALVHQLAIALVVAALLEVTLLRLATRVGVHLPRSGLVSDGLQAASFVGSLAFNSASILAIGLVALLFVGVAVRMKDDSGRLVLGVLAGALLLGLGLSLTSGAATWDGLFGLAATLLVLVLGVALVSRSELSVPARLASALIVGAYLFYQYYSLSYLAYRLLDYTSVPPLSVAVLRFGEGLAVLGGAAAFWAWGSGRWRRAGVTGLTLVAGLVGVVALSSLTPSSTTSILALWTTGMSFFLPLPLYLLSLALYLLTVVACLRDRGSFWIGTGLLLVLVAGYMPEATYHHLLVILGIGFLAGMVGEAEGQEPVFEGAGPLG